MPPLASIAQVLIAAPVGFIVGLAAGLGLASWFQIVPKREAQQMRARENPRDD